MLGDLPVLTLSDSQACVPPSLDLFAVFYFVRQETCFLNPSVLCCSCQSFFTVKLQNKSFERQREASFIITHEINQQRSSINVSQKKKKETILKTGKAAVETLYCL